MKLRLFLCSRELNGKSPTIIEAAELPEKSVILRGVVLSKVLLTWLLFVRKLGPWPSLGYYIEIRWVE